MAAVRQILYLILTIALWGVLKFYTAKPSEISRFDIIAPQDLEFSINIASKEVFFSYKKGEVIVRKGEVISPPQQKALEKLGIWKTNTIKTISIQAIFLILTGIGCILTQRSWPYLIATLITFDLIYQLAWQIPPPIFFPFIALLKTEKNLWAPGIISSYAWLQLTTFSIQAEVSIWLLILFFLIEKLSEVVAITLATIVVIPLISVFGIASAQNTISIILTSWATAELFKNTVGKLLYKSTTEIYSSFAKIDHPLLQAFSQKAPGSWQHSINVAFLAERVAHVVGADPVICRVGALYHDIGKMKRPIFFIENQPPDSENPTEKLSPSMAAKVIISHVKDGIIISREHALPSKIIDIIREHHGTTLLSEFYKRAKEQNPSIDEQEFRYPGPIPQSKESAIVMICDSVEAAIKSQEDTLSREDLPDLISRVINAKKNTNQLLDCGLSTSELKIIERELISLTAGMIQKRKKVG